MAYLAILFLSLEVHLKTSERPIFFVTQMRQCTYMDGSVFVEFCVAGSESSGISLTGVRYTGAKPQINVKWLIKVVLDHIRRDMCKVSEGLHIAYLTFGLTSKDSEVRSLEPLRLLDHAHGTVYLSSSLTARHLSPSRNISYLFSLSF